MSVSLVLPTMSILTWHEPLTYKWAITKTEPTLWSLGALVTVTLLVIGITAITGASPVLGWPVTVFIALVCGLVTAYLLPFLLRFGNRTCSIDESGIKCDELVAAKWRNHIWSWESIQYCVIKPVVVRRRTYQVLLIHTASNEEHSMAISDEIDRNKVESAILRSGCQLRTV